MPLDLQKLKDIRKEVETTGPTREAIAEIIRSFPALLGEIEAIDSLNKSTNKLWAEDLAELTRVRQLCTKQAEEIERLKEDKNKLHNVIVASDLEYEARETAYRAFVEAVEKMDVENWAGTHDHDGVSDCVNTDWKAQRDAALRLVPE